MIFGTGVVDLFWRFWHGMLGMPEQLLLKSSKRWSGLTPVLWLSRDILPVIRCRSCTIRGSTFDLLLTDAQLERSQILTLTSTNRRLLVRTKSAVWSVMSRSCWPQRLVYLSVAFGLTLVALLDLTLLLRHFVNTTFYLTTLSIWQDVSSWLCLVMATMGQRS
jgi:hypothetical protein